MMRNIGYVKNSEKEECLTAHMHALQQIKMDIEHPRLQEALELYGQGTLTVRDICTYTQISRSTLYRHIHALSIRMRT
ncbi:TPA: helix-turn-helix domain-containing protein [Bacillus cereus]|nr:helix-turn-helix domain-containing protein [Bacillus cereus]